MTKTQKRELARKTKTLLTWRLRRNIEEAKLDGMSETEIFALFRECFPACVTPPSIAALYDWLETGPATRTFNAYESRLPKEFKFTTLKEEKAKEAEE